MVSEHPFGVVWYVVVSVRDVDGARYKLSCQKAKTNFRNFVVKNDRFRAIIAPRCDVDGRDDV